MLETIQKTFNLEQVDIRTYSPLALAFIGDSVFATVVKTVIIERGNCSANKLHQYSAHIVRAESQAMMYDFWMPQLSEEEQSVLKRGKNAKSVNTAKNASVADYRKATAVEALIGYLFLKGEEERICELISLGMDEVYRVDKLT